MRSSASIFGSTSSGSRASGMTIAQRRPCAYAIRAGRAGRSRWRCGPGPARACAAAAEVGQLAGDRDRAVAAVGIDDDTSVATPVADDDAVEPLDRGGSVRASSSVGTSTVVSTITARRPATDPSGERGSGSRRPSEPSSVASERYIAGRREQRHRAVGIAGGDLERGGGCASSVKRCISPPATGRPSRRPHHADERGAGDRHHPLALVLVRVPRADGAGGEVLDDVRPLASPQDEVVDERDAAAVVGGRAALDEARLGHGGSDLVRVGVAGEAVRRADLAAERDLLRRAGRAAAPRGSRTAPG